jgi:nitroimidazol reductase NimA-like FMN-containing flavoprotein (pyridoxamine 5'-phosphate oxidase superfamily)
MFARNEEVACSWRQAYRSVIVEGQAVFVNDYEEKIKGLNILMKHYSDKDFQYSKPAVNNIQIIKIPVASISGRSFEYHRE